MRKGRVSERVRERESEKRRERRWERERGERQTDRQTDRQTETHKRDASGTILCKPCRGGLRPSSDHDGTPALLSPGDRHRCRLSLLPAPRVTEAYIEAHIPISYQFSVPHYTVYAAIQILNKAHRKEYVKVDKKTDRFGVRLVCGMKPAGRYTLP